MCFFFFFFLWEKLHFQPYILGIVLNSTLLFQKFQNKALKFKVFKRLQIKIFIFIVSNKTLYF